MDRLKQFAIHLDVKGSLLWANATFCSAYDLRLESVQGASFSELLGNLAHVGPESLEDLNNALTGGAHLLDGGDDFILVGHTRWYVKPYSSDPSDKSLLLLGWDEYERGELEQFLLRRVRIAELTYESILITDANGVIEYVNPAFCRSTGYGPGEVIGNTPPGIINLPEDMLELQRVLESFRAGKTWDGLLYLRRKNGEALPVNVRICPVRDHSGVIQQYVAFGTDISRERSLEKQIRELQRIESLGTLAAGVAHRFNNILASVIGHTELLAMLRPDDPEVKKRTEKVLEASIKGRDIIAQLSQFSHQQEPQTRPVDIAHLLRHATNFINTVTTRHVRLEMDIPEEGPRVMANSDDLHQVFVNLFTNAVQAMPSEGARVTVSLKEDEMLLKQGDMEEPVPVAVIRIADNGAGIPEKIQHRIFEPFFTTRSMAESSGMGLSIVHGIVQNHGGLIDFESQPGNTIFRVVLPIFEPERSTAPRSGKSARILLSAPAGFALQSEEHLLREMDFQVVSCSDDLALHEVLCGKRKFSLALVDLPIGEDPGLRKIQALREFSPDMPIVLMIDMAETIDFRLISELNISSVLHKPCPVEKMRHIIRKLIRV